MVELAFLNNICMISIAIVLWAEWKGSGLTLSALYV